MCVNLLCWSYCSVCRDAQFSWSDVTQRVLLPHSHRTLLCGKCGTWVSIVWTANVTHKMNEVSLPNRVEFSMIGTSDPTVSTTSNPKHFHKLKAPYWVICWYEGECCEQTLNEIVREQWAVITVTDLLQDMHRSGWKVLWRLTEHSTALHPMEREHLAKKYH